jgi:hypothetical protein
LNQDQNFPHLAAKVVAVMSLEELEETRRYVDGFVQ